jgi:uncharacterized membrane protein YcaP (DUF421 family)
VDIVLRAAVAYFFIIFLLRIIGRRELSTLAPSDLVLLVVMGDLVQNGVTQSDQSVSGVFLAVSTFALLTVAVSVLTYKSPRAQTLVDVAEEARGQGIERLDEVKWCVLETSGTMSFIKAA